MNDKIQLIKPYISFADIEQDFNDIFQSGIFTKGPHVQAFAKEFADYVDAKHAFMFTSATTALWTCMRLLNIGEGDEVAVADFSFPASANVIEDVGAKPIFIDVDLNTYNMCAKDLRKKITPKTKAVMFVAALGNPTGLHEILSICKEHNIPLIEDAACAIGSHEAGKKCGAIADLTCFSFHPRKLMCTGEGGAITTNNDEWAQWLQSRLNHGADGMAGVALDFKNFGYNFRMNELQAAMGRKQLHHIDAIITERQKIRDDYNIALAPLGFIVQHTNTDVHHNVQSLVFRVPDHIQRDDLHYYLKDQNIETSIGTYCMSGCTYFKNKYKDVQKNSAQLQATTITLPCYHNVPVDRVTTAIQNFCEQQKQRAVV